MKAKLVGIWTAVFALLAAGAAAAARTGACCPPCPFCR